MPDFSAVVVIPTNSAIAYLNKQAGQSVTYAQLVALGTYLALAQQRSYGQLQNLGPTNAEIVVLPTNTATIYISRERTLATYLSIAASWGTTYASITGINYGQLGVVP